jgi:hypothetical protein
VDSLVNTNISEEYTLSSALKVDAVCPSEMLVYTYKSTWHHSTENEHVDHHENVRSYVPIKAQLLLHGLSNS